MGWDLLAVMHLSFTRLCNSGVHWLSTPPDGHSLEDIWSELDAGAALFSACQNAPVDRVAIENPAMHRLAYERIKNYRPFAQSVQPWQFEQDKNGPDNEKKHTCFWLRGLPTLAPTGTLDSTTSRDSVFKNIPDPDL